MTSKLDSKKKDLVRSLYSSDISVDIIALQTSLDIPSVQVIKEVQLGEPEIFYGLRCPYYDSIFTDTNELSKHIDRIHVGSVA